MNGTTFDALDATKTLREAGFENRQAEAVAGIVRHAVNADRDTLATKADIAATRADIAAMRADIATTRADIDTVRADVRADIASLEARIYRTLWIQAGAIASVVVAAVKLL